MSDWAIYLLLLGGLAASLFVALLQLPGLWLMLLLAGGYVWATDGKHMGIGAFIIMLLIAIAAEIIETFAAAHGAKRAGAGKTAMALSIVGAIIGGIFLSFLVPVPVLGTLVGVCLGAFIGAAGGEAIRGGDANQSMKSGLGAAAGRLVGTVVKLGLGFVMVLVAAIAALPIDRGSAGAPPVASAPATAPATQAGE